jgi:serine/threonine-protein kinase
VSAELGLLAQQWDVLPADVRQRRVAELARYLVDQRRALSVRPDPALKQLAGQLSWVWPVLIVAAGGTVLALAYRAFSPGGWAAQQTAVEPVVSSAENYERERQLRAQRVCEATAARVMRGASVGPTDVEGWVVEIGVLREMSSMADSDSALSAFVSPDGHRFVWAGAPELARLEGPSTRLEVTTQRWGQPKEGAWQSLRLIFFGRYVGPYFSEQGRAPFVKTASALSEALHAKNAAVYGRCEHSQTHLLGSWFQGPDPGGAATAIIYFMGTYAPAPHLRPALLGEATSGSMDRPQALDNIAKSAARLSYDELRTAIGAQGGAIAGKPPGASTVTFSFRDGNQAARASRDLSRKLGLAENRELETANSK